MRKFLRALYVARKRRWAAVTAILFAAMSVIKWTGVFDGVPTGRAVAAAFVLAFVIAALADMFLPDLDRPDRHQ